MSLLILLLLFTHQGLSKRAISINLNEQTRRSPHWIHQNLMQTAEGKGEPLSTSEHIKLTNLFNKQYSGTVLLGNPPQAIDNIVFDTGSVDLWVFGDTSSMWMVAAKTFHEKVSTTFMATETTFVVKYIAGFAKGVIGYDSVQLGDQVVSSRQKFGVVEIFSTCIRSNKNMCTSDPNKCNWDESQQLCEDKKYPIKQTSNGILGLGYKKKRSNSGMPIVVEGSPLERFSFYMTGSSAQGSLMIIGEPDSKLYKEPWIHCPLVSPSMTTSGWTIKVDHIRVGNKILEVGIPLFATVDTGSSVIGVDTGL